MVDIVSHLVAIVVAFAITTGLGVTTNGVPGADVISVGLFGEFLLLYLQVILFSLPHLLSGKECLFGFLYYHQARSSNWHFHFPM